VFGRRFVLDLGVVVIPPTSPCQASLVNPNADALYPPATQNTAEAALTRSFLREGSNGAAS
jgi:hypothetical protein